MYLPPETFRRRSLYGPPPPGLQTRMDDQPTLLFSWFCTAGALTMILIRCFGRMVRNNKLFAEDKVMILSTIPLLARMGLIHVVLLWGTNNVDLSMLGGDAAANGVSTEQEIWRRTMGSKLVLAARIFYALFIWTAKFTVSEFLKRLTHSYWRKGYQISLHSIRIFLVISFIAVFLATIAECRPVEDYWQVTPDPGSKCRQAYAQLFTMGVADIITDLLLIIFPLTIIIPSSMPWLKKLKLILLFSISGVMPAITILRMISVVNHQGEQQRRTVYASGEILAAASVANAVILGSFLRDTGPKKAKYRAHANNMTASTRSDSVHENAATYRNSINGAAGSTSPVPGRSSPQSRRPTFVRTMEAAAGSDEDLFRDMCYRSETFDSVADRARSLAGHDGAMTAGYDEDDEDGIQEISIPRPAPVVSRAELDRHASGVGSTMSQDDIYIASPFAPQFTSPFASPAALSPRGPSPGPSSGMRRSSMYGHHRSSTSSSSSSTSPHRRPRQQSNTPRLVKTVTFSDPGGLLDPVPSEASTPIEDIVSPSAVLAESRIPSLGSPLDRRRPVYDQISEETAAGGANELQDVGGLLSP